MLQLIRIICYEERWQNALISCTIFPYVKCNKLNVAIIASYRVFQKEK